MEKLTIQQAANYSGLSKHTLRYYEKIGLLRPKRTASGHRRYDADDLDRLQFLACLRATDMPIRHLKAYAELSRGGRETLSARLEILEIHKQEIHNKIAQLQKSVDIIEAKMTRYQNAQQETMS